MKLEDLKECLLNNKLTNFKYFIFKYTDSNSRFLAKTYIKKISSILKEDINWVEQVEDLYINSSTNLFINSFNLLVLDTEKVEDVNINRLNQCIILCNKISIEDINLVEFDKVEDWQIIEYMKTKVQLAEVELKWLYDICKGDLFRIENELNKLTSFSKENHEYIFNLINDENGYSDLTNLTIFDLTNSLVKKDYSKLNNILENLQNIEINVYGLVELLHQSYIKLLQLSIDKNLTFNQLGCSEKQFKLLQYNVNKYTFSQLNQIIHFLDNFDTNVKIGKYSFFEDTELINYIIFNIMGVK